MGKIYCTECGAELDESVNFCSKCGTSLSNKDITPNSNESEESNEVPNKEINTKDMPEKSNNNKHSHNSKVYLGIAGVLIIICLIGAALIGFSGITSSDNTNIDKDTSEQPFIENIYGIDFSIPGYFKNVKSEDYEDDGTGVITCTRTYERPDGTGIAIIVATCPEGWDLDNRITGIDMTVNGHHGKLDNNGGVFGYLSGDKLVVISGTSQKEVEEIIIE